jgi:hypothetical protein
MRKFLLALTVVNFIPFQANAATDAYFYMSNVTFNPVSISYEGENGEKGTISYDQMGTQEHVQPGKYKVTAKFLKWPKGNYTCTKEVTIGKETAHIRVKATDFQGTTATCLWSD